MVLYFYKNDFEFIIEIYFNFSIVEEFEKETGEKLAPDKNIAIEYMKTLEEVYVDQTGRYFSCSEKSKHIAKMVAEQNTKVSPNYRGRGPINKTFNNAFPTRALVSYVNFNELFLEYQKCCF